MNIKIEIECDTIGEVYAHLTMLRQQIKAKAKKLNLDPIKDEFPPDTQFYDDNCYGTHEAIVIEEMNGKELANKLFPIHTHAELCKPEEIVYKEKDVIELLKGLGQPEPVWQ